MTAAQGPSWREHDGIDRIAAAVHRARMKVTRRTAAVFVMLLPSASWAQGLQAAPRVGIDSIQLTRIIGQLPQMRDAFADPPLWSPVVTSQRELRVHLVPMIARRGVSFIVREQLDGSWTAIRLRVRSDSSIDRSVRTDAAAFSAFWRAKVLPILDSLPDAARYAWGTRTLRDVDTRSVILIELLQDGRYTPWSIVAPTPPTQPGRPVGKLLDALARLWRAD